MRLSKRQLVVIGLLGAGGAAGFFGQFLLQQVARGEIETLRTANRTLPALRMENLALRKTAVELARLRSDDAELADLRFQAVALQTKIEAAAMLPRSRPVAIARPPAAVAPPRITMNANAGPRLKRQTVPVYPSHLRSAGVGGTVDIVLTVDRDGNIADTVVVNSTRPEFEAGVLEAIKNWKYEPARHGHNPVEATIGVPITFDSQKGRVSIGRVQEVQFAATPPPPPPPPPDWF